MKNFGVVSMLLSILFLAGCSDEPAVSQTVTKPKPAPKVSSSQSEAASGSDTADGPLSRNHRPLIEALNAVPLIPQAGLDFVVEPVASDAESDEIRFVYAWTVNSEEYPWGRDNILPGDAFKRGDLIGISVTPLDGGGEGEPYEIANLVVGNADPVIHSDPPDRLEGWTFIYQAEAEDADGDPLAFALENAPPRAVVDAESGRVEWPIRPEDLGEFTMLLVVRDTQGGEAKQEIRLTLSRPAEGR